MKIGIASDAHCNVAALQTAIDQMASVVDEILFAGDAVYEYRMSNEIVDLIRTTGMPSSCDGASYPRAAASTYLRSVNWVAADLVRPT